MEVIYLLIFSRIQGLLLHTIVGNIGIFSVCYLNVDDVGVVKEKLRDTIESNF